MQASLDWSALSSLRLRARAVADGLYAGAHRSMRRGSGIEFGGFRPYVVGDDLRFLDRRAMLRYDRPMIREFQTETERGVWLVVDASRSMAYRGATAKASKLEYASMLAAALARVALGSGDPVALETLGGEHRGSVGSSSRGETFTRIADTLEAQRASGDIARDLPALDRALAPLARDARRGAIVVLFTDLIDLPEGAIDRFAALGTRGRTLVCAHVLDDEEATFPFDTPVRFRAVEGGEFEVETDPQAVRSHYLAKLAELRETWAQRLTARGGALVEATTSSDPVRVVRRIVDAIGRGAR